MHKTKGGVCRTQCIGYLGGKLRGWKCGRCPDKTIQKFQSGGTTPVQSLAYLTTNLRPQSGAAVPVGIVCGAIQAVLPHPNSSNICFAGAVNGGVWRTRNCLDDIPKWKPLTDKELSQSVGGMAFDELDENIILVAIGTRSSFFLGGESIGMLLTRNAHDNEPNWTVLNNAKGSVNFQREEVQFYSVFVRGNLMMATAFRSITDMPPTGPCDHIGIWQSKNAGITWSRVLIGAGHAIAPDPNDPNRFYAALDDLCHLAGGTQNGVYRSDNQGDKGTWVAVGPNETDGIPRGNLTNAKISVSAADSRVWIGLVGGDSAESFIGYSDTFGATWISMDNIRLPDVNESDGEVASSSDNDEESSGFSPIHFALLASPSNSNEVYVGGDSQDFPNFLGAQYTAALIFRGDASVAATNGTPSPQWEHMTDSNNITEIPEGGTASGSAAHADTRDMKLTVDGSLIVADDGGITIRTFPSSNNGDFYSLCGDMQVFEAYSVAYEPRLKTVLFGTQDNSVFIGELGVSGSFKSLLWGDGNACMIDFKSDPENNYYYYGAQYLGEGQFARLALNLANRSAMEVTYLFLSENYTGDFLSVTAMNPVNQKMFAVAVREPWLFAYAIDLTMDRGDTFTLHPLATLDEITSMAWSDDGFYLYAMTIDNGCYQCIPSPWNCVSIGGFNNGTKFDSLVRTLVVDATDSSRLYAMGIIGNDFRSDWRFPSVYFYDGSEWTDITIAGSLLDNAPIGAAIGFISRNGTNTVVAGTNNGVMIPNTAAVGSHTNWTLLATGLPRVAIAEIVYDETNDVLVLSTMGRGLWFLENASFLVARVRDGKVGKSSVTQGVASGSNGPLDLSILD